MKKRSPACRLSIMSSRAALFAKSSAAWLFQYQLHAFIRLTTRVLAASSHQRATLVALAADLKTSHANMKPLLRRNLGLQPLKQWAGVLLDAAALETCQVHVIDVALHFVEVLLAIKVHQVEFIHESKLF